MRNKLILLSMILNLFTISFAERVEKIEKINIQNINEKEQKDYTLIRDRWVEFLIGLPQNNKITEISKERLAEIINLNEKEADKVYSNINLEKDRKSIFKNAENMKSGVDILIQYDGLVKIAKAYITPGTKYYKNEKIKNEVFDALEWLYDNAYHEGLPELGNWWQWELGIPKKLNDLLMLMYNDIPRENRIKYLKASQYFQPDAKWSAASPSASYSTAPNKRLSTGGNRIDTSIISFLRGVLMEDKIQILDGLDSAIEVGELVTSGDGFYKDGSFVQHDNVAYNGTYAAVLFEGLGSILWLIDGTEFKINDSKLNNIYDSILNGYTYLMINGGINDSVSGRSISRDNSSDIERGKILLSSMALLTKKSPLEYQEKLKSLIKKVILDNNYYSIVEKENNPTIKEILIEIMENNQINPIEVKGTKIFGAMDRTIYFNDRGGKIAISMHSNRIANYETMNGENVKGWYTGEGMTYIYGEDSSNYIEFWPTVDMYHLSGVTNSINKMKDKAGERRVKNLVTPKSFTGGVETGEIAFIGMDLLSWNKQTRAKKSWFMIDGVILCLGSNIRSNDGEIHTTIDNRILNNGKIYVDGQELIEDITIKNPKNVTINFNKNYKNENIGYKVINAPELKIEINKRNGSWKNIGGVSDTEIIKNYFLTYINHGDNPRSESYSYVILPMFSEEEVENYDTSRFEIIKLDNEAHIVKDKKTNILAIHFWKDTINKFENIKVFSSASILKKEEGDFLELYISDPTQLQNYNSIIEINGKYELLESTDKDISVKIKESITRVEVNLRNNGSTQTIKLRKVANK